MFIFILVFLVYGPYLINENFVHFIKGTKIILTIILVIV